MFSSIGYGKTNHVVKLKMVNTLDLSISGFIVWMFNTPLKDWFSLLGFSFYITLCLYIIAFNIWYIYGYFYGESEKEDV